MEIGFPLPLLAGDTFAPSSITLRVVCENALRAVDEVLSCTCSGLSLAKQPCPSRDLFVRHEIAKHDTIKPFKCENIIK
jgi:hypothetical protein